MLQITTLGNLAKNAETKTFNGKNFLTFSVASKNFKDDPVTWIDVTYFKSDKVAPYLLKGTKVLISGQLKVKEYPKKDGTKGTSLSVNANTLTLVSTEQKKSSTY
jgi:single-strand DNA-binding protein